MRLLRYREVVHRTGLSRSAIYVLMNQGKFPLYVKLGVKARAWHEAEVDEWIETRERGQINANQ